MDNRIVVLLFGLVFGLSSQVVFAGPPADIQAEAKSSYIFKFDSSVATSEMSELAATLTDAYNGSLRHVFTNVLHGFSASISGTDATDLVNENDEVISVVNNGVGRIPGAVGGAQGGKRGGEKGKPMAAEVESWGVDVVGGPAVASTSHHAWIIDTGIDDYYDGIELNIGEGENYVSKGKNTTDDTNGHGTHIAGILASIDNDTGVVGIAGGAMVHPVRVLHNSLWGTIDDIIAGVNYVAGKIAEYPKKDTHVVNMSLTIGYEGQEAAAAEFDLAMDGLIATGVPIAVCVGNDSSDVSGYTPANSTASNVYTVASIDSSLGLASDSNYGTPDQVDFVAPGVSIESLKPGHELFNDIPVFSGQVVGFADIVVQVKKL